MQFARLTAPVSHRPSPYFVFFVLQTHRHYHTLVSHSGLSYDGSSGIKVKAKISLYTGLAN